MEATSAADDSDDFSPLTPGVFMKFMGENGMKRHQLSG